MTALDTWKRGPPGRGRLRRLCSAKDGGIGAEMVGLGSGWFGDTTTDIGMSPLLVIPYHRGRGKARPYFQNHHCCRELPYHKTDLGNKRRGTPPSVSGG